MPHGWLNCPFELPGVPHDAISEPMFEYLRMRLLPVSAMYTLPAASLAIPEGDDRDAGSWTMNGGAVRTTERRNQTAHGGSFFADRLVTDALGQADWSSQPPGVYDLNLQVDGEFRELKQVRQALADPLQEIIEAIKPEAVYFTEHNGSRGATLVVDVKQASDIPSLAEPWFLTFDADVDFRIAMTPEDLGRSGIEALARATAQANSAGPFAVREVGTSRRLVRQRCLP